MFATVLIKIQSIIREINKSIASVLFAHLHMLIQ